VTVNDLEQLAWMGPLFKIMGVMNALEADEYLFETLEDFQWAMHARLGLKCDEQVDAEKQLLVQELTGAETLFAGALSVTNKSLEEVVNLAPMENTLAVLADLEASPRVFSDFTEFVACLKETLSKDDGA